MILSKNNILYSFLIISFYSSMFLPILQGLSTKLGPIYLLYTNIFIQSYIFLLPLLILFFTKLKTKQFALIILLLIYIAISQPFTNYSSFNAFFTGYRTYLAILFYIPIIYDLMRNYESFDLKIEWHIRILFFIVLGIFLFEFFSRYLHNDLYYWFLSLAVYKNLALPYSRPIGIGLDIHMQGILLAFATFYFFINKTYKLAYLFLFALFLSGIKTWLIGVFTVSIIYFFIHIEKIKIKEFFERLLTLIVFNLNQTFLVFILLYPQLLHYKHQLSPSSHVASLMTNLWANSFGFMTSSIIPIGFLSDIDRLSPIMHTINMYTDIPILYFGAEIGTLALVLYIIIVYYHALQRSKYTPIILLSFFSFIHAYYLNHVGVFIIFTYFNLYYIIENQKKYRTTQHSRIKGSKSLKNSLISLR